MTEQVMLYEVKSSAADNAKELFSNDSLYFYWNTEKFINLYQNDFVFFVNRIDRWVLLTQIDKINISTTQDGNSTKFDDLDKTFIVRGNWAKFIRFKVVERRTIPENWNWKSLGSSEIAYLHGARINTNNSENRASNITQLAELNFNDAVVKILDTCLRNFTDAATNPPAVWFVTQGATFKKGNGMNFLWAPQLGKGDVKRFYWDNVSKVKKGDFIFNYSEGALRGISVATSDAYDAENEESESSWGRNGFKVDIALTLLSPPLKGAVFANNIKEFNEYLRSISNKPFSTNGTVNQGYLYEFSKEAGRYVRDQYGKSFGNKEVDAFFDSVQILPHMAIANTPKEYVNILTAIKTKPFILLAGISGTGKSRLVRTLAFKSCYKKELQGAQSKPGNFELIPVKPNWHDSSELIGYVSRINGEKYVTTTFLRFVAKAWLHRDLPFFLCMDEMNLAPVEQYFAEYLSVLETRQVHDTEINSDYIIAKASFENAALYDQLLIDLGLPPNDQFDNGISLPANLVVIGTVNMDETTYSFSRKVLDRAMTFEMNEVDLRAGLDPAQNEWSYPQEFIPLSDVVGSITSGAAVVQEYQDSEQVLEFLEMLNEALDDTPFKIAYRVRDEFLIYCYHAGLRQAASGWLTDALDQMTYMKILPRIEGDEGKTGEVLDNLINVLNNHPKSLKKLEEMKKKLQLFGYTSFWS